MDRTREEKRDRDEREVERVREGGAKAQLEEGRRNERPM